MLILLTLVGMARSSTPATPTTDTHMSKLVDSKYRMQYRSITSMTFLTTDNYEAHLTHRADEWRERPAGTQQGARLPQCRGLQAGREIPSEPLSPLTVCSHCFIAEMGLVRREIRGEIWAVLHSTRESRSMRNGNVTSRHLMYYSLQRLCSGIGRNFQFCLPAIFISRAALLVYAQQLILLRTSLSTGAGLRN